MARGLLSGVVGGFLQGAGEGITEIAKQDGLAKREARLAELQHGYAMERQGQQNAFTASENAANRENTLKNTTLQGENTRANTILQGQIQAGNAGVWEEKTDPKTGTAYLRNSRTGDVKAMPGSATERWEIITGQDGQEFQRNARTGELKAMPKSEGRQGAFAMSEGDQRLYKNTVDRHTDPNTNTVDWTAVGRDLRARGRDDLANIAIGEPPGPWTSLPIPKDLQPPPAAGGGGARPPGDRPPAAAAAPQQPEQPKAGAGKAPNVGEVISGYRFKGGNPRDQKNWEPAS